MPPKKSGKFPLDSTTTPLVPQWMYRNDAQLPESNGGAWTAYNASDNANIEAAYQKGLKMANLGTYIVDTMNFTQFQRLNPLKVRKVTRRLVSPSSVAAVESSAVQRAPRAAGVKYGRDEPVDVDQEELVTRSDATVISTSQRGPTTDSTFLPQTPSSSAAVPAQTTANLNVPTRPSAETQPVVFLSTAIACDSCVLAVIQYVLANTPTINRASLDRASVLITPTRRWLRVLGRSETEQGVFITIPTPIEQLPKQLRIPVSSSITMTAAQVDNMAKQSIVTHVGRRPKNLLLPNTNQGNVDSISYRDHLKTQQLMVSGPVSILYDGRYQPLSNGGPRDIIVCSTPGINFAYSKVDKHYFSKVNPDADEPGGPKILDKDKILSRMRLIWQHVLLIMDERHRVEYPVLCAIGCGAFKGVYGAAIPRMWATALAQVICNSYKVFKHIKAVFVSLPTFGRDNNFAPFQCSIKEVLAACPGVPHCPIVLVEDASMIDLALSLLSAETQQKPLTNGVDTVGRNAQTAVVGVLNPSDVQALRHGWIGMYWDGGHIALEEVLAMQTTLLFHHVGLNGALFTDPSRLVAVKKVLPDMAEDDVE